MFVSQGSCLACDGHGKARPGPPVTKDLLPSCRARGQGAAPGQHPQGGHPCREPPEATPHGDSQGQSAVV